MAEEDLQYTTTMSPREAAVRSNIAKSIDGVSFEAWYDKHLKTTIGKTVADNEESLKLYAKKINNILYDSKFQPKLQSSY